MIVLGFFLQKTDGDQKLKTNQNIQYLRGLAALIVVFAHTTTGFGFAASGHIHGLSKIALQNIHFIGQVGVGVFFIISGYIMSMTTNSKAGGIKNSKTFLAKRAVRIYPLYFFWTTVCLILWSLHLFNSLHYYSLSKIVTSYLLIPYSSFTGEGTAPVLQQGWTLIYEAFYYLLFAVLIFFGQHRKSGIYILAILFIALGLTADSMSSPNANSFFSFKIYFLFIVGMFIFHYEDKIQDLIQPTVIRIGVLAIFVVLTLVIIFKSDEMGEWAVLLPYLASILLFLYVFSAKKVSGTVLEIGNSSYSLYLSHTFATTAYSILVIRYGLGELMAFILGIFVFLIAIVIGEITYRLIERRLIFKTAAVVQVPTNLPGA